MRKNINALNQKLRNFSFLSLLMTIVTGVSVLVDVAAFLCYQFAGRDPVINTDRKGQLTNAFANQPIRGMVFFLLILVSVIIGIIVLYKAIPYIKPKDKKMPNRAVPIMVIVGGGLHIASIPYYFMMIREHGRTEVGVIICLVLTVILAVAQFMFLYPMILGRFYMPELAKRNPELKEAK